MQGQTAQAVASGGMEGQLRKLRDGTHPKTGAILPPAVELNPVIVSFRTDGQEEGNLLPDGFYTYVPEVFKVAAPAAESSTEKRLAFLERIRAKEQAASQSPGVAVSGDPLMVQMASSSSGNNVVRANSKGSRMAPIMPHGTGAGGVVCDYLVPDEPQRGITSTGGTVAVIDKCMGDIKGMAGGKEKAWERVRRRHMVALTQATMLQLYLTIRPLLAWAGGLRRVGWKTWS